MPTFTAVKVIMTCLEPITAWQKRFADLTQSPNDYYRDKKLKFKKPVDEQNYQKIKIPCGHCLGCRLDHANTWATRIMLEAKRHKNNCFITLTYNNKNLPKSATGKMTLRKKDIQDFIKRLRFHINEKILYFGCGEYGSTTYRPHYHLIIFGWEPPDIKKINLSATKNQMFASKELEKIWGNGFVTVEELNYNTACYTARYVQKKAGIKPQKRILDKTFCEPEEKIDERTKKPFFRIRGKFITSNKDLLGREKEFLVMSKKPAIAKTYWDEHKDQLKKTCTIPLKIDNDLKIKPIPRYFKKQWDKEDPWGFTYGYYPIKEQAIKNYENQLNNIDTDKDKEKILLEMTKTNLEAKAKYLKRGQN